MVLDFGDGEQEVAPRKPVSFSGDTHETVLVVALAGIRLSAVDVLGTLDALVFDGPHDIITGDGDRLIIRLAVDHDTTLGAQ